MQRAAIEDHGAVHAGRGDDGAAAIEQSLAHRQGCGPTLPSFPTS